MIRLLFAAVITAAILITGVSNAQSLEPNRPIRFVVPFAPGGQSDVFARILAEGLSSIRQTNVENRTGGYIAIAGGFVMNQPADGHTIINIGNGYTTSRHFNPEMAFDPREEFSVIATPLKVPKTLLLPTVNTEIQDFNSLVSAVRARPNFYTYFSTGGGGTGAMASHLFTSSIGSSMINVPYRGSAPAVTDFLAGRLTMMFETVPLASQINGRGARMIAVTSDQRLSSHPDVPTLRELGINHSFYSWQGIFVRANTPRPIREQLNNMINQALNNQDVRRRITGTGIEESWIIQNNLTDTENFMNSEIAIWRQMFGK
jgi:tripartite-type tricarboxylate transporter receptor subunit TctC